jgi:WD40 repeat protein
MGVECNREIWMSSVESFLLACHGCIFPYLAHQPWFDRFTNCGLSRLDPTTANLITPPVFIYNRWDMLKILPSPIHKSLVSGLLLSLLISACAPVAAAANPSLTSPTALPTLPQATQLLETKSAGDSVQPQTTVAPQGTPTIIPPAPNRQLPEDWRDWPVIPIPSARARQIYQQGIAAGTDPTRLSKVGDCQSIQEVLLGRYDKPSGYLLRENPQVLAETIKQFTGSFGRDGEAVQGGFNAASELSPLWSNPDTCQPGETPLECEVRVHNPSIMLISLEVWWDGRSPAAYEKNMRQIIDFAISKGILPILSTKADNVEGDHSINLATARLAYEYDLPLWNWWRAAQALPNRGLDPTRPDGFHISQDAWDERSFTALQAINSVWRGAAATQAVSESTPSNSLLQPANPLVSSGENSIKPDSGFCSIVPTPGSDCANPTPTTIETPAADTASSNAKAGLTPVTDPAVLTNPAGYILLSNARRSGETVTPQGIYVMNPATGVVSQILPIGTSLQAVSPDGLQILYSRDTELIQTMLDGSQQSVITTKFQDHGSTSAGWQADGKALQFLTAEGGNTLLAQYPLDGSTAWKRLSSASDNPVEIYEAPDLARIYWENGTCPSTGACTRSSLRASGLDGSSLEILPAVQKVAFSPDGRWLVYEERVNDNKNLLTLASADLKDRRKLENIGDHFLDFSWSPDGSKLSLLTLERSDYSGKWLDIRNMVITTSDMGTKILPPVTGINNRAIWSPDGGSLLLTGTQETADGYLVQMQVMDVVTGAVRDLTTTAGFKSNDFIYTTDIHWVKPIQ